MRALAIRIEYNKMVNNKIRGQVRVGADMGLSYGAANPVRPTAKPLEEGGEKERERQQADDDNGRQPQQ